MDKIPIRKNIRIIDLSMDQSATLIEAELLLRIHYDENDFWDNDEASITIKYKVNQNDDVSLKVAAKKAEETIKDWISGFDLLT